MLDAGSAIGALMEAAGAMGADSLSDEQRSILEAVTAFKQLISKTPVVCRLVGSPEYKFVAVLDPAGLRVEADELNGEMTLFATLQRKLRDGETWNVLDVLGGAGLPAPLRAEFESSFEENPDISTDAIVEPPAAIVTPIALYR